MPTATFAAGCFWGVESRFASTPGVTSTAVGYMGGDTENPTYQDVCNKTTGHAEVVQLEFDDQKISYDTLLDIFWQMHDPTTLNRQGRDIGIRYRSTFFSNNAHKKIMPDKRKEIQEKSGIFGNPIVTEITPAFRFWRAEEYHQQYHAKNGRGGCSI